MKASELRNKSWEELQQLLVDSKKKLHNLRVNLAAGKVKNIKAIKHLKKDIARILTILNEMKSSVK
ncbi:50S ribosomal protein L29 [bacterium]|nr:50S ribosomal protein L29 [bacterium]